MLYGCWGAGAANSQAFVTLEDDLVQIPTIQIVAHKY